MIAKRSIVKKDSPRWTDIAVGRAYGRDHRDLLRSTGHLFRDGRWVGDDDPYHVFRDLENPGFGTNRTLVGPAEYFIGYNPEFPEYGPPGNFNWRPCISRGFESTYWNVVDETPLPDPLIPDYADWVLELNAKGTDYISRFRPGNPIGSLGRFIGELHDLPRLPLLMQRRTKKFRDLGSEYLNVEFGWIPFVRDVINLGHTQLRMQAELDKLVKNNGIRIKRRSKRESVITGDEWSFAEFPYPFGWIGDPAIIGSEDLKAYNSLGPYNSGFDYSITGSCDISWRNTRDVESWFVGTFTYYVPDIGSSEWTDRAKMVLSGLAVTPDQLYSLIPWTWLADWFGNVGKILSNLATNAVDNEVYENCHIMQTVTDRLEIDAHISWDYAEQKIGDLPAFTWLDPGSDKVSYSHIEKQKIRQKASPFGFGLVSSDFTFRQKSILAALLFSRKRPTQRTFGLD